jgi:hypothetical protein
MNNFTANLNKSVKIYLFHERKNPVTENFFLKDRLEWEY